jgi:hypothetical protein
MKTSVRYEKIFATFAPARRRKIKKRAAELIAEEFALRDLRKVKQVTRKKLRGG